MSWSSSWSSWSSSSRSASPSTLRMLNDCHLPALLAPPVCCSPARSNIVHELHTSTADNAETTPSLRRKINSQYCYLTTHSARLSEAQHRVLLQRQRAVAGLLRRADSAHWLPVGRGAPVNHRQIVASSR